MQCPLAGNDPFLWLCEIHDSSFKTREGEREREGGREGGRERERDVLETCGSGANCLVILGKLQGHTHAMIQKSVYTHSKLSRDCH